MNRNNINHVFTHMISYSIVTIESLPKLRIIEACDDPTGEWKSRKIPRQIDKLLHSSFSKDRESNAIKSCISTRSARARAENLTFTP